MRFALASGLLLCTLCGIAQSQTVAPPPASSVTTLPVISVSGVQPGPGLWKISKDGHVLWVLGTLSPLPEKMQWQSRDLAQVIAHAQVILQAPKVTLKVNTGFFGKLFLLPSAYSARKNDDGKTLQQVLPPELYARWLPLKQNYIGDDRGIERWRPIFAAQELYKKALKGNGLSGSGGIPTVIDGLAKQYGVTQQAVDYQLVIDKPREALKAFKSSGLDDVGCFGRTLDAIEQDMSTMTQRANAWATGDLETLRQLPDSHRRDACIAAIAGAGFAQQLGIDDVPARLQAVWLAAARTALQNDTQSFAVLPMDELLSPTGYVSRLKAEGYVVQSPDEADDDGAAPVGSVASPAEINPSH
jgi:uncharacterized protein YbaP (TraB family)